MKDFEDCSEPNEKTKGTKRDFSVVMSKDVYGSPIANMVLSRKWIKRDEWE